MLSGMKINPMTKEINYKLLFSDIIKNKQPANRAECLAILHKKHLNAIDIII